METPGDPDGLEMDGWIEGWMCHGRGSGVRRNEKKEKQNHCQVAVSTKTVVLTNHVCHYVMHLVSYIHIFTRLCGYSQSPLPCHMSLVFVPFSSFLFPLSSLSTAHLSLRQMRCALSFSALQSPRHTSFVVARNKRQCPIRNNNRNDGSSVLISLSLPFHPFPPT